MKVWFYNKRLVTANTGMGKTELVRITVIDVCMDS